MALVPLQAMLFGYWVASTKPGAALARSQGWTPWQGRGWFLAPRDRGPEANMYGVEGHLAGRNEPPRTYRLIARLSQPVVFGLYRLRVEGHEHLPATGGYVVAANHLSDFDPWPLGLAIYPRQLHFMAKSELYNPVLKPILDVCGVFPVRRGERDPESFRTAVRLARAGGAVAMFPEGTRRSKGLRKKWVSRPHPGAARIALAAEVPLVPAAITGTDRLRRLGPLRVRFGPPVELGTGVVKRQAAEQATAELMRRIDELERA